MSMSSNLAAESRLLWLRRHLNEHGHVRVMSAAAELDVSEMTIRRDLHELDAQGFARRVRGGAVAIGPIAFEERHQSRAAAKARIAAKVADLIPRTGAIGMDASSTTLRIATAIGNCRDLIVLTNGWETFHALQEKAGVTPILTGGELDSRTGSLVGPIAYRAAGSLLMSRLFASAAALDPEFGPSEPCLEEAEVKRALCGVCDEVVLCVDSSKLRSRSISRSMTWEDVDLLVTELDPKDRRLDPYREHVEIR